MLDGTKTFVTGGPVADYVVVAARTDPGAEGHDGISLLLVERGTTRFESGRVDTVGWRTSHTGELSLDGCRIPADQLLGQEGRGFHQVMENFQWERLVMALAAVAAAERTLEMGEYAGERTVFGRPVASLQVWRHRFADLHTEIAAARSLAYQALRSRVAGRDATREAGLHGQVVRRRARLAGGRRDGAGSRRATGS